MKLSSNDISELRCTLMERSRLSASVMEQPAQDLNFTRDTYKSDYTSSLLESGGEKETPGRGLFRGVSGGQKTIPDTFMFDHDATPNEYGKMDLSQRSGISKKSKNSRPNADSSSQGGCCNDQCSLF